MSKLWRVLPPPSPDTSGVASVFLGMEGHLIFYDVQGCASNYCVYDESRVGEKINVFPAQLSNLDIIMGGSNQVQIKVDELLQKEPDVKFIALAGSPISVLIGADLAAEAKLISEKTGKLTIPVDVTGELFYDVGAARALEAIGKYMLGTKRFEIPKSVNILGALTMDMGAVNIEDLRSLLGQSGMTVLSAWGYSLSMFEIENAPHASVNLVVSYSGLKLAHEMKERFGIPYISGIPCGDAWAKQLLGSLNGLTCKVHRKCRHNDHILIVGEQILANSIRNMLRMDYSITTVMVASLFDMEKEFMEPGDVKLENEKELLQFVHENVFDILIGDPFFERFAESEEFPPFFVPFPHLAISSLIYADIIPSIIGQAGIKWFDSVLADYKKCNDGNMG